MKKYQALFVLLFSIFLSAILCQSTQEVKRYPEANCIACISEFNGFLDFREKGFGTGFFINNAEHPYFITNRHVVTAGAYTPLRKVSVLKDDWNELVVRGDIVCYFNHIDIAVLQLEKMPEGCSFCPFDTHKQVITKIGDDVHYFGQPGVRGKMFLYAGKISVFSIPSGYDKFLDAVNIQATGGNSGAPMFNEQGRCIGVISSTLPNATQSLYVRLQDIKSEFERVGLGDLLKGTFTEDLKKKYKGAIIGH